MHLNVLAGDEIAFLKFQNFLQKKFVLIREIRVFIPA